MSGAKPSRGREGQKNFSFRQGLDGKPEEEQVGAKWNSKQMAVPAACYLASETQYPLSGINLCNTLRKQAGPLGMLALCTLHYECWERI